MSDVEVTYEERMARADTARVLSALAKALAGDGKAELTLGPTTVQVTVPAEVRCKVEVEIDRDELEFEIELRWSTAVAEPDEPEAPVTADDTAPAGTDESPPAPKRARSGSK